VSSQAAGLAVDFMKLQHMEATWARGQTSQDMAEIGLAGE